MSLSGPVATVLAALITVPSATWGLWRNKKAKRDALEKLVSTATALVDKNYREQIARTDKHHREQVEWLQSQITYYQKLSQPSKFRAPRQPPELPERTDD